MPIDQSIPVPSVAAQGADDGVLQQTPAPPQPPATSISPPPAAASLADTPPASPHARNEPSEAVLPRRPHADEAVEHVEYAAVGTPNANPTFNADQLPAWEATKTKAINDMASSDHFLTPIHRGSGGRGIGRGRGKRVSNGTPNGHDISLASIDYETQHSTPKSAGPGRPRGRGKGGRPRGRGRGAARGGKRKRDDGDDGDDGDSDSSDEVTAIATMTKSGRSVQKPTNFVPPPPSPTTNKRKRPYNRRNPESAVCKVCLRGSSPTSNMIVFCDGCNAPYHRWCHHPPIDQAVVDEVDREWFCKQCESERVVPVPEAEVASFISADGASAAQRQKYFASLPPGMLATLLTKATTLHPDLPLFPPDFKAKQQTDAEPSSALASEVVQGQKGIAATSTSPILSSQTQLMPPPRTYNMVGNGNADMDEGYGREMHPPHYPRPGQGLMSTLPPEQEDLQWLVEDDMYGAFTHVYRTNANAAAGAPANGGGDKMEE